MSANYFDFSGKVQNDAKSGAGEQNVSLFRFAFVQLVFTEKGHGKDSDKP
jgi:hypothetical protein